ncbi:MULTISPECIES: hypothetical protein [Bacillaceae]|uniref:hypothetical protein n=1 Tax=Bacillaceae TaxID=186817 RepID=UPI0006717C99|nr:hypothetical protein [Bacillus sp. FJAT-27916]
MNDILITADMMARYHSLSKEKKAIEDEMNVLKEVFHQFFDKQAGVNQKGELIEEGLKLQRQIRKTEKYLPEPTVQKLEELKMKDLIKVIKIPDEEKINASIKLGFMREEDLEGCKAIYYSKAISIKQT